MHQTTVQIKDVKVLIRGIWTKKKFTEIERGQTFMIEKDGCFKKYIARTEPYWDKELEAYVVDVMDKNKLRRGIR
ncbi:hypothetical protein P5637_07025 [Bacillus paralicheniformis]|uniref:SPbeta phage protein n=1 Tax=Bacillus paralicheniformis TaxID=1648923 RepID=A0ABY3FX78_9BACI|nr:hypothetical protein [Bacillus paralicheniformis]TWL39558.1 hypothetical protein CHCC15381_4124 [Bacillus paralicheniformis]WEZ25526.1 hypothetical protein P5637_07025 [Bacillus paralicheniformis]